MAVRHLAGCCCDCLSLCVTVRDCRVGMANAPIPDVEVVIYDEMYFEVARGLTDENGQWCTALPGEAPATFTASVAGFLPDRTIEFAQCEQIEETWYQCPESVTLTVSVIAEASCGTSQYQPVPGFSYTVSGDVEAFCITGTDGTCSDEVVAPDDCTFGYLGTLTIPAWRGLEVDGANPYEGTVDICEQSGTAANFTLVPKTGYVGTPCSELGGGDNCPWPLPAALDYSDSLGSCTLDWVDPSGGDCPRYTGYYDVDLDCGAVCTDCTTFWRWLRGTGGGLVRCYVQLDGVCTATGIDWTVTWWSLIAPSRTACASGAWAWSPAVGTSNSCSDECTITGTGTASSVCDNHPVVDLSGTLAFDSTNGCGLFADLDEPTDFIECFDPDSFTITGE